MPRKRNLQELIYDKIDTDEYLIELYNDLLKKIHSTTLQTRNRAICR